MYLEKGTNPNRKTAYDLIAVEKGETLLNMDAQAPNRVFAAVSYTHLDVYKRQGCIRSQGFGCSPIKVARELGSERRETVRSLSVAGAGDLKGACLLYTSRCV